MKKSVKYIATVIGNFGGKNYVYGGQTVKTRSIYEQLVKKYGEEKIDYIDTFNWKKNPLKLIIRIKNAVKNSLNILTLPSRNGIKIFPKLIHTFNKKYQRKTFYIVIGGWLPEDLSKSNGFYKEIKKFTYIMPETKNLLSQVNSVREFGEDQVVLLSNFKDIDIQPLNEDIDLSTLKLCTFSRVCKNKGMSDCVEVARKLSANHKVLLTFYGPVDEDYKEEFNQLLEENKDIVTYGGSIEPTKSSEVLSKQHILLFLSHFTTEGFPGTIIDAYAAGIPVFAYWWKNGEELIEQNKTGYYVERGNVSILASKIKELILNVELYIDIRNRCLDNVKKYLPKIALVPLFERIDGDYEN